VCVSAYAPWAAEWTDLGLDAFVSDLPKYMDEGALNDEAAAHGSTVDAGQTQRA